MPSTPSAVLTGAGAAELACGETSVITRHFTAQDRPTRLPPPFEHAPVDAWTQSAEAWRAKRKEFRP